VPNNDNIKITQNTFTGQIPTTFTILLVQKIKN